MPEVFKLFILLQIFLIITSADAGINQWTTHGPSPVSNVFSIALSAPDTVYAGVSGGHVFKSADAGINWSDTALASASAIFALVTDPSAPNTIYAGTNGNGAFKSINGGTNWTALSIGLPVGSRVYDMAVNPGSPNILYAGTGSGVYKSTNGGNNWASAGTGLSNVYVLAVNPAAPDTVYAGTYGNGMYKSSDGGLNWTVINTGISDLKIPALVLDPADPDTIYIGTGDTATGNGGGIFRSSDGGNNWIQSGLSGKAILSLAITSDIICAGTKTGVHKSTDEGNHWIQDGTDLTTFSVWSLASNPAIPNMFYAGTNQGVYDIEISRTVTFQSAANGTIAGISPQTVTYNGSCTAVTAVPNVGYRFVNWTGTGGFLSTANPLTVTNITTDMTITANFQIQAAGSVVITGVSDVKATTALAKGFSGRADTTERGFFWWNDETYWGPNASGLIPAGYGPGEFSLTLSNLPVRTQLYVSAYIKVGDQLITSANRISITTADPMLPTVITKPGFVVNGNDVFVQGEMTDVGSSSVTIYGFVYAKHPAPTVWDMALPFTWDMTLPISSGKAFEGTIKNLSAGLYYFRSYAHNSQGTAYGEEYSFTIYSPGFTVSPAGGLITSESGGKAAFTVKLDTQPTAEVTVAISSSDTNEATVSPENLIFTSENWDIPRIVTVKGTDDTVVDGDKSYTLIFAAAVSDDPAYDGLKPDDVSAVNTDNDTPPLNHPPKADPQSLITDQDKSLEIILTGSDEDGDTLTYSAIGNPRHGILSGSAPNLIYMPEDGFFGTDSFSFETYDGKSYSAAAAVTITVRQADASAPVYTSSPAPGVCLTMSSSSPKHTAASLIVTNMGNAGLFITGITFGGANPTKFSVSPNSFPLDIAAGKSHSFTIIGNGSSAGTFTATMAVAHNAEGSPANYTLSSVISAENTPTDYQADGLYMLSNQAPVADRLYISTKTDQAIAVKLTGRDADAPNWFALLLQPLTYSVSTQPKHGTLSGTAPDLTYTPDPGFVGSDCFTFEISDGITKSAPATVAVIVHQISHVYVGDKYETDVFCAEYQGNRYGFRMNYTPLSSDPSALYWKMDISAFGRAYSDTKGCISVGNDLKLNIPSAYFQGKTYAFTLDYTPISGDPLGLYWKMDSSTFTVH